MEKTEQKENKMGYMPENKLLMSMSLPIMISMIIQALYNIVDSMFVAQLSQDALTGNVQLIWWSFPIAELMSLACCVVFYIYIDRKIIRNIPLEPGR